MNVSILPVPILSLKKFNRMTDMNIRLDYSDIKFQENGKLKLLIIVGTRPEIIRLAAVINKCRVYFDCRITIIT